MEQFKETITFWLENDFKEAKYSEMFTPLLKMFKDLNKIGMDKSHLKDVGFFIVKNICIKIQNDSLRMLYALMLAEEIKYVYNIVNRTVRDFKEEKTESTIKEEFDPLECEFVENKTSEVKINDDFMSQFNTDFSVKFNQLGKDNQ
jgi:hypothetical protein